LKNLDFCSFDLLTSNNLISLKTDVNDTFGKQQAKKLGEKLPVLFVGIMKVTEENSRIRIRIVLQRYGSADPDPYQNCFKGVACLLL
jgi:hypothetical protein